MKVSKPIIEVNGEYSEPRKLVASESSQHWPTKEVTVTHGLRVPCGQPLATTLARRIELFFTLVLLSPQSQGCFQGYITSTWVTDLKQDQERSGGTTKNNIPCHSYYYESYLHITFAHFHLPFQIDIVLAHGVTSKSEKQWGRAKDFIPERWCKGSEPLQASRAHPYSSVPFGENCPASGIAGKMLGSLVTRVVDRYRLEWHGPAPNVTTAGVNRIDPPYYFVLQNAA